MELTTKEIVKKMILDSQEMIRDYEVHSKKVNDMEVADLFKKFAEECGYQAAELQKILKDKY
jgi:rubrerythrin